MDRAEILFLAAGLVVSILAYREMAERNEGLGSRYGQSSGSFA